MPVDRIRVPFVLTAEAQRCKIPFSPGIAPNNPERIERIRNGQTVHVAS
jgi:hypothetical protein